MTADTPSILVVRDGSTPPNSRNVGGTADSSGTFYPEHGLRFDGNPVGAAAPLPVVDTVSGAALGTPADVAWGGTGSSSIVAALKALWVALTGTVKTQIQTGTNAIGTVGVTSLPALPAGSNTIGGVTLAAAIPTGANTIGNVGVTSLPALAAGSAAIGTVGVTALPSIPAGTNAIGSVFQAGSTGTDYSANAATVPMNGFTLLVTIPVTSSRAFVEVQNQSAGTLQVVRDDGAGNNQTSILLSPGSGAGQQGGGWASTTFKGRIRIYGASGSEVAAYQD